MEGLSEFVSWESDDWEEQIPEQEVEDEGVNVGWMGCPEEELRHSRQGFLPDTESGGVLCEMEGPSEFVSWESDDWEEQIPEQEVEDEGVNVGWMGCPEEEGEIPEWVDCPEEEGEIPDWMDFPEEEGENDDIEAKTRRVMCLAWMAARKELKQQRGDWKSREKEFDAMRRYEMKMEMKRRREEMKRRRREDFSAEAESRTGWKVSEMDLLSKLMFLIWEKKLRELEESYAMKRQLEETKAMGLQLEETKAMGLQLEEEELMETKYHEFRNNWIATHSCWGGAFEDITKIRSMCYTDNPVPQYVYIHGPPDTLQIFSIKVLKKEERGSRGSVPSLPWPLHVFGLIAVRDPIDQNRNIIFNRQRDECQTLTPKDQYLILTGPTRAVVMDDKSIPVTIEAELKVRGNDETEDKRLIFGAKILPSKIHSDSFSIVSGSVVLMVKFERVRKCVESTIFLRVIEGTWPTGYNGQFTACTSSDKERKIILVKFRGDLPVDGGIVEQSRFVVSVEVLGALIISYKAWRGVEVLQGELSFGAEKKGRSHQSFQIGSCTLEAIVAWSPIRPACEELVSMSEMDFAK